jgi:adenosylcobyric acid synthase
MSKAIPLMIQGTHSDAGKSAVVTALCRIFARQGCSVAPFKSQNMALNSYITLDGKEIGRAQGVQAEAAGIAATTDMNPILIKPSRRNESQIVVHGRPYQNMMAGQYRSEFFSLGLQIITEAYGRLSEQYDRIIIEGAGSPAEINLNDRELVNMRVARMANAPVILVGDIDKGGVFASLVGTLQLLDPEDRGRVIGVIINKFRGDISLLEPGLRWFEEYTGKPVLGVIPFIENLDIEAEDSLVLSRYSTKRDESKELDVAVIRYPMISNFTDVDPFTAEEDCHVRLVNEADKLGQPDLIVLPGSKNTIEDLQFLWQSGLTDKINKLYESGTSFVFGICGGYQMLGGKVEDPHHVESPHDSCEGLGLLPLATTLRQHKDTVRSSGIFKFGEANIAVEGYEIHMGITEHKGAAVEDGNAGYEVFLQTESGWDGLRSGDLRLIGTYFHGIFHNDLFRHFYLDRIREIKGLLPLSERLMYTAKKELEFARLADTVERHIRMDDIERAMLSYQEEKKY